MPEDKELIHRALMGDQEAQKECTEKEIALPCPFCGGRKSGKDGTILKLAHIELFAHKRTGKCILDGMIIYNLADWNTRPAPPIEGCAKYRQTDVPCSDFNPKE